jgi:hypothetical protein
MECVVALIGVVVADLLLLPEKEATSKKPLALSVNVTKEVPGDSTWSPATAATVDDEVSMMEDDDDDSYISPRSSKVLLAGRVAKDHSNVTNEEESFMLEDLDDDDSYISPRSSKVLLAGRVAKDRSNATNEEESSKLEDLNTHLE